MKRFGKYFLGLVLTLGVALSVQAQKFGYVNSAAIFAEMPAVKSANAEVEALQKQLQKKGQSMVQELEKKYGELQLKEQNGELSPKQIQDEATKLETQRQDIAKFELEMQQQVGKKQETLLQPILDKINTAIEGVAKEEGYQFIFDSSQGVILYAEESTDITAKVKTKLGM